MEKRTINAGFTLIELLVVIAIIAMLMAVIMPALNLAKLQAQGVVCLSNLNGMGKAWVLYAEDNNYEVVGAFIARSNAPAFSWVEPPQDDNRNPLIASSIVEEKINGIKKGLLYPYIETPKPYHCPSDQRSKSAPVKTNYSGLGGYRSYSIVGGVRGVGTGIEGEYIGWGIEAHTKTTTIQNTSGKYIMLEEMDGRGFNHGSWVINPSNPDNWIDPIAIWHGDSSTFSFADGHAERHKWHQKKVIEMAENQTFQLVAPGEDTDWMHRGYPYLRIP